MASSPPLQASFPVGGEARRGGIESSCNPLSQPLPLAGERSMNCVYRSHDVLGLYGRGVDLDVESSERVANGIGDRRGRRNGAAFAYSLHAEGLESRRRLLMQQIH